MVSRMHVRSCKAARVALVAATALGLIGCGTIEPTEVVVVVTSDLSVPGDLDRVLVSVTPPEGAPETASADLTMGGFPRSIGLYNPDGPLGPYRVEAIGLRNGAEVVRRRAVFQFTRDRSLEIELPLLAACVSAPSCLCTDLSVCSTCGAAGTCESALVSPEPFDGVGREVGELDDDLEVDLGR